MVPPELVATTEFPCETVTVNPTVVAAPQAPEKLTKNV